MSKQFVQTKKESDSVKDWLVIAMCFSKALDFLLVENEGICIKPENDMLEYTSAPTIIVYKENGQIKIVEQFMEIPEGTKVMMH